MNLSNTEKLNHPYYQLMEFKGEELNKILKSWSRKELIEWLCWNDNNGVYKDEDSQKEFGNLLGKEEAISIIVKQIEQS